MACTKRDQLLGGDLHAILDKIKADMLQITKNWNQKWLVQHQGSFNRKIPATNACSTPKYVHLQGWSLKFKTYQIPIEILEHHATLNSSYQNLNIFLSKAQKNYSKMNECNTAIIKLWNFSGRFQVKLRDFASRFEYVYCWHWRVSPRR